MKRFSLGLLALTLLVAAGCDSGGSPINEQTDLLGGIMGSVPFNTLSSGQLGTQEDADAFFTRQIFVNYTRPVDTSSGEHQPVTDIHLEVYDGPVAIPDDSDIEQHEVYMQIKSDVVSPGVYEASSYASDGGHFANGFFAVYQVQTSREWVQFYVQSGTLTITAVDEEWMEGIFSFASDRAQVLDLSRPPTSGDTTTPRRETRIFDDPITFEAAFRVERRLSRFDDDSAFEATVNGAAIVGAAKVIGTKVISNPTPFAQGLWKDSLNNYISLRGYPELYNPRFPEITLSYFNTPGVLGPKQGTYEVRTIFAEDQDTATLPVFMPLYTVLDDQGDWFSYTASSGTVVIQERTEDWIKGTFELRFDGVIKVDHGDIDAILEARQHGDSPYLVPRTPEPLDKPLIITGHFAADYWINFLN